MFWETSYFKRKFYKSSCYDVIYQLSISPLHIMDSLSKVFYIQFSIGLKLSSVLYILSLYYSISATNFALSMGFSASNLTTPYSEELWSDWKSKNCQPNYWKVLYTQIIYCRCSLIHIYRVSLQIILQVVDHTNQQVTRLSEMDNARRPPL